MGQPARVLSQLRLSSFGISQRSSNPCIYMDYYSRVYMDCGKYMDYGGGNH